jgi:hypothetical protein
LSIIARGGREMDVEYDIADLKNHDLLPINVDRAQELVFLVQIIPAIGISVFSLSGGWSAWYFGTGILTPVMPGILGYYFDMTPGITWERERMVPFIARSMMVSEFELERYLLYKKHRRFALLVGGYLSIIFTQVIYFQISPFLIGLLEYPYTPIQALYYIPVCMLILFFIFLLGWISFIDHGLKSRYSDIKHIIQFNKRCEKALNDLQREQKEGEKA